MPVDTKELFVAVSQGDLNKVKSCFAQYPDLPVNTRDIDGQTLLFVASESNQLPVVEYLLSKRANVNFVRRRDGFSALLATAYKGHVEVARVLLDHDADLNFTADFGYTALSLAAYSSRVEMAALLVKYDADTRAEANQKDPLVITSREGSLDVAISLMH